MEVTKQDLETIIYGVKSNKLQHDTPGMEFVRVEPGMLISTNGRVLIVREVFCEEAETFEPFNISVADVKEAIKANKNTLNAGLGVVLHQGDEFMAKIGVKKVAKQAESFPRWGQVPKKYRRNKKGAKRARFNPAVFMRALQGMKDCEFVDLRLWDPENAVRLDGKNVGGQKVVAFVMPLVDRKAK